MTIIFQIIDIALWSANSSAVDLFLKKPEIPEVSQRLKDANVRYSIVVDDYQKLIEQENPPKEEIEALQNRNGMLYYYKKKYLAS